MSAAIAPQINVLVVGETRNCAVSFAGVLDSGELISTTTTNLGVTTAAATDGPIDGIAMGPKPSTATALTYSLIQASTAALTINGSTCAIAQVLQFRVTGGERGGEYVARCSVVTTSTNNQTLVRFVRIQVK